MTSPTPPSPTPTVVRHAATLLRLSAPGGVVFRPVEFTVTEVRGRGWFGSATLAPGAQSPISLVGALELLMSRGLAPGVGIALRLLDATARSATDAPPTPAPPDDSARLATDAPAPTDTRSGAAAPGREGGSALRTWPSVVTEMLPVAGARGGYPVCEVKFADPLSALWETPVWGVFGGCSPGELLGGALSLAGGGDGAPTLSPALEDFPEVRVRSFLRPALQSVPYAIAHGEPLGYWLRGVFGRLGVRVDVVGHEDGTVGMDLRDQAPGGHAPLEMTLDAGGEASAGNALLGAMTLNAPQGERGAVLDNPASGPYRRFGAPGAVGQVLYTAETGLEEARVRAGFSREASLVGRTRATLHTVQPAVRPGRLLKLTNQSIDGVSEWQIGEVHHELAAGGYLNYAVLNRKDVAWRETVPPGTGQVVVSGVVNDGKSPPGASVPRDRLGRIPVSFVFSPGAGALTLEAQEQRAAAPAGAAPPAVQSVPLPIVEPMAGGLHGFVNAHRQGDYCRVSLQHPMLAEIIGFSYNDRRRVNEEATTDLSAGFIVHHGTGQWSGVGFGPGEVLSSHDDASRDGSSSREETP